MDTDRNLLFGVIALQADLLDSAQFAEGCAAWAARKNVALADLLVERGWLTRDDRERVDWLLERKLKKHGGDASASLAAAITPEAHRVLAHWDDPAIQSSLAKLSQEPNAALLSAPTLTPITRDRYTLTALHAKGGIGQVWRAHDARLGRDVALKELQPERASDARLRHYFITEAQVTGQLEHPGIIPVYELTQPDAGGLPFYTMRFVQGRTLRAATRAYHEKRKAGKAGALDLRELLDAFVKVCQTVAYAHARGVIHRDLKGQNIVLGDFGEVIVLDWGLAKVLGQGEQELASPPVVVPAQEGANATVAGEVIGTPAYMAPEQAAGRLDRIDRRTDVYGLGAILYEILTDQPPFRGADQQEVLRRVREEPPAHPRSLHADVSPALEAVCLKALAKQSNERYASAAELARDVQRWLADEPVSAYREPWLTRLGRWSRRHRTAVVSMGVGLAAAVVFLAILVGVIDQGRRRSIAEQHRTEVARQRARQALDEMSSQVIDDWLSRQPGKLQPAQTEFLNKALSYYQEFAQEAGNSEADRAGVAKAHERVGSIYWKLGQYPQAEEAFRRAIDLYTHLAGDFPNMTVYRAELASNHSNLGNLLQTTSRSQDTSRLQDAEKEYQTALALEKPLADQFRKEPQYRLELSRTYNNLGHLLEITDRRGEAIQTYLAAISLKKQLAEQSPKEPRYRRALALGHNNLGNLLTDMGKFMDAEKEYQAALAIRKQLADDFANVPEYRRDLANTQNSLGRLLLVDKKRLKEAESMFQAAVATGKQLAAKFRAVPEYRQELAQSEMNLGLLLATADRPQEAEKTYHDVLDIQKQLAGDFADLPDYQEDLVRTMTNVALFFRDRNKFTKARDLLEQAETPLQAVLKANPENPRYCELYRENRSILTTTLAGLGDHAAARKTAAQLSRLGWNPAVDAYDAACALALCVPLAEKENQMADSQRRQQAQAYADQAMILLRQAVAQGHTDAGHMKEDTDLAALRQRGDFQKLVKDLEAKKHGSPAN